MTNLASMTTLTMAALLGVGSLAALFATPATADSPGLAISEPISHANLTVYFLRGASAPGTVPLTLAEALAKGTVTVHETGNVNRLEVENRGAEDVFIQSGDIVKGGQQDRVLTVSLLLPAHTAPTSIDAYCVEQGRWTARGVEDVKRFASAEKQVPSREARLAMMMPAKPVAEDAPAATSSGMGQGRGRLAAAGRSDTGSRQSQVWDSVGKIQRKLSENLQAKVASPRSDSSLQLALENDKLAAARNEYLKALVGGGRAGEDIVGVVFAINGRLSSAEVYSSNGLFRKMWDKLADTAATEAIGEKGAAAGVPPPRDKVATFLAAADMADADAPAPLAAGATRQTSESKDVLAVKTRRNDGMEVHRVYLAK